MSYTVLARKYRSGTFDEVVGQDHVAQTLKRAIESGRIAHAYLFCGTRGVGKTSMARILAKALNCEKSKDVTTEPCGKCESCLAIARGEDIDVIEIDAASNRGIDEVRRIISNASFSPARSRYKVYIIDEVHAMTKDAFNALLKVLEEPPSHVKFILATTEPEKVLLTILSRCQRYDFRNISTREIAEHLKQIVKQEKTKADEDALLLIAKAGAGSMRDALSLLDRLLSVGEKQLTVEMIEQLLGLPKSQLVFDLAQSIGEGDVKATLSQTDKIISGGLSPDGLVAALIEHLRNLLIVQTCGPESDLIEVPGLAMKELQAQGQKFEPTVLAQDITLLEELRRQMRQSGAGRALLDATLVRLALAEQFTSVGELLERVNGSSSTHAPGVQKKKPESITSIAADPVGATPASPSASSGKEGDAGSPPAAREPAPTEDDDDNLPRPGKVWEGPSLAELARQQASRPHAPAPEPPNIEPVDPANLPAVWQRLLDALAQKGTALHSLISMGKLVGIADNRAIIRYGRQHETFVKMIEKNGKKEQVREILSAVIQQNVGVAFELEEASAEAQESLQAVKVAPKHQPLARPVELSVPAPPPTVPTVKITQELIDSLRNEPLIKALMDDFGAQIVKVE